MNTRAYRTFDDFYRFYLSEHSRPGTKRLHFVGTVMAPVLVGTAAATGRWWLIGGAVAQAYACAWISHYVIEKNKPVAFDHPLLCFVSDWRMALEMATGKIPF